MSVRARLHAAHLDNWLLDAEHGQIVYLIENVEDAITSGKDETTIRDAFDRLVTWTAKHFAHENDQMLQSKFKAAKDHIDRHRQLIETLKGFATVSAEDADDKVRAPDAIQYLEEWLVHHIETDDTALAAFLASKTTRWVAGSNTDDTA